MTKKLISILAIVVMALCLISGGCAPLQKQDLKSWQELIKINLEPETKEDEEISFEFGEEDKPEMIDKEKEMIEVTLYFIAGDGKKLTAEKRTIIKEEGIGRSSVEELIKGPDTEESLDVFPEGTKLLDINIKPEGVIIVDFNSNLTKLSSEHQERLAVYSIVNTLGQFPAVQEVQILINGDKADTLAGHIDISKPLEPDYTV